MKRSRKVFKICAAILGSLFIMSIFSVTLLLEPNFKVKGWQSLDAKKLTTSINAVAILDSNEKKYEVANNNSPVSFNTIPKHTIDAFISIEDKRFYAHKGIDYKRVVAAIKNNILSAKYKEGASTISQQLIKNTHLSSDKTIKRKLLEFRIARDLERKYTKNEIIEKYLNIIYFGNGIYGIKNAAKSMFNKNIGDVTIAESALLAAIIKNPSGYNPYKHLDATLIRKNLILKLMKNEKAITNEQYNLATKENIKLTSINNDTSNQFTNAVLKEASKLLKMPINLLLKQNLTIGTSLNNAVQMTINNTMRDITLERNEIMHAIVMDNSSGSIIADYGNTQINLAYTARQPGSVLKPTLCYAPAYENNLVFNCSQILDEKTNFNGYTPSNYKNKYYGYVSVNDSIKYSLNVPAIKLLNMVGIDKAKNFAKKSGLVFTTQDNSLSLALGAMSKGITLQQIANAYQAFANEGEYISSNYIRYIKNSNGNIIYSSLPKVVKAMSKETAYLVNYSLKQCAQTGTAKKLKNLKNVAAKTGTVGVDNSNSDAYCIAYTKDYTVAVWIGSANNKTATKTSGGGLPTIIAGKIISGLSLNERDFTVPENIVYKDIDSRQLIKNHNVTLAGIDMPIRYRESMIFNAKHLPSQYSYYFLPDMFSDNFSKEDMSNFEILP